MAIPVIHSLATQYAQHQIMVLSIDTFSPLFENVPDNVIFRGADFRGEHAGLMGLGWLYNDLKEEKSLLKSSLEHLKNLIYNLVKFLMDRIYRNKDKEKYMEFAKELYEHGALDDEDFKLLQDNKNTNNKNKSVIEKDDIER